MCVDVLADSGQAAVIPGAAEIADEDLVGFSSRGRREEFEIGISRASAMPAKGHHQDVGLPAEIDRQGDGSSADILIGRADFFMAHWSRVDEGKPVKLPGVVSVLDSWRAWCRAELTSGGRRAQFGAFEQHDARSIALEHHLLIRREIRVNFRQPPPIRKVRDLHDPNSRIMGMHVLEFLDALEGSDPRNRSMNRGISRPPSYEILLRRVVFKE